MRVLNKICCLLIPFIFCLACATNVENAEELKEYITNQQNGLLKKKTIGDIEISAVIKPSTMLVAQELGDKKGNPALVDSLRKKYEPYLYIVLSMSGNGKEIESYKASGAAFSDRVQTLSFRMRDLVTLIDDSKEKIPILDYAYQRMFGVGGPSEMLFVFDKSKIKDAKTISLKVKDIGLGIGTTKLKFDVESINNIPNITM